MSGLAERDRRIANVRERMREVALDALVAVSDMRHNERQGDVRYLTGFQLWCPPKPYCVVTEEAGPVLIVGMPSEAYWASAEADWVSDVRTASSPIEEAASTIKNLIGSTGRVGVSGLRRLMSVNEYDYLHDQLSGYEIVDATPIMESLRSIKSEFELEHLRASARIVEMTYDVLADLFETGRNELELAHTVEAVARGKGATDVLILSSQGPFLRPPRDRRIEASDFQMFSIEISGPSGYWAETGAMLSAGLSAADQRLLEATETVFSDTAAMLRPGVACSDIAAFLKDAIASAGYSLGIWGGHGIGLGIPEAPSLVDSSHGTIQDQMTFGFHPHVIDPQTNHSVYISDTLLATSEGGISLGAGTPGLVRVP